jgi:hypothetical protein
MKTISLKTDIKFWWECPECKSGQDYKYNNKSNTVSCKDCRQKFKISTAIKNS